MYLPTVMLSLWVEAAAVARYDAAHRLIMVGQALLAMYFTNLYPALARAVLGSRERLRALLRHSTAIAAGGLLVVALAFAVEGRALLPRLFGDDFAHPASADCLALLAFVLPVLACRGHARLTLLALGEARRELLCSIAGTVALPLLLWWAVPGAGVVGAARALLLAELLGAAVTIGTCRLALRRTGLAGRLEAAGSDA
jgi:O-antigen/teichoic acid export membrane protein